MRERLHWILQPTRPGDRYTSERWTRGLPCPGSVEGGVASECNVACLQDLPADSAVDKRQSLTSGRGNLGLTQSLRAGSPSRRQPTPRPGREVTDLARHKTVDTRPELARLTSIPDEQTHDASGADGGPGISNPRSQEVQGKGPTRLEAPAPGRRRRPAARLRRCVHVDLAPPRRGSQWPEPRTARCLASSPRTGR